MPQSPRTYHHKVCDLSPQHPIRNALSTHTAKPHLPNTGQTPERNYTPDVNMPASPLNPPGC